MSHRYHPLTASALIALFAIGGIAPMAAARGQSSPAAAATAPAAASAPKTPVIAGQTPGGLLAVVDGQAVPVDAAIAASMGDAATLARIIDEGTKRNEVMKHIVHLSEKLGPRLTGSTRIEQSSAWLIENYNQWGLTNVHDQKWGTIATRFDRGPSTGKIFYTSSSRTDPTDIKYDLARELQFSTLSWTSGTKGAIRGPVVRMPKTEEEYAAIKPKLSGAWVLLEAPPAVGQRGIRSRAGAIFELRIEARKQVADGTKKPEEFTIRERMIFDGVAGWIGTSRDERVWTSSVPGWRDRVAADIPPDVQVSVRLSDYDFINSRISDGEAIEVEFDLQHTITAGPIPVYNTMAEIKGSELPNEIIIVSAHLDTWDGPGSLGVTDNGTGTVVTMEAARILAAAKAKPRRTIRFIHWTGEEQGLLGSKEYVDARKKDGTLDSHVAVFNDDGGTNSQGGAPGIASMVPMLAAASAPANNLFTDAKSGLPLNVNIRTAKSMPRGGSSDHASFNAVGIPGFFWDEVGRAEYAYGWHTQNDKLDLVIPEYLKQSATNSAITAYRLANAAERLPRVPAVIAAPKSAESTEAAPSAKPEGTPAESPAGVQ